MRNAMTAMLGLLMTAGASFAAEPIADREVWLSDAIASIKAGDLGDLQAQLDATLGETMHEDVMLVVTPLKQAMGEEGAVYVDLLDSRQIGTSFEVYSYAAYYGDREFVFYSFQFARLEDGWNLVGLEYADELEDILN